MNEDGRPRYGRRQRRGSSRDGMCQRRGRGGDARGGGLSGRTTTRALVAVGAYAAQDLRDAEGVMRPLLRRAALRLATSPSRRARRLGSAYLRLDPPDPTEIAKTPGAVEATGSSSSPRALPPAPDLPDLTTETDARVD